MKALGKFLIVLFAFLAVGTYSGAPNSRDRTSDSLQFNRLPESERGPAYSSPPLSVTPEGDIKSPYPPYHRPDQPRR